MQIKTYPISLCNIKSDNQYLSFFIYSREVIQIVIMFIKFMDYINTRSYRLIVLMILYLPLFMLDNIAASEIHIAHIDKYHCLGERDVSVQSHFMFLTMCHE